jgi:hypothetical protein
MPGALLLLTAQPSLAAQFVHPSLGYSFTYPDSWQVVVYPTPGRPVSVTTSPECDHGPVDIPPSCVVINIQVLPSDQTNDSAISNLPPFDTLAIRTKCSIRGIPAERLDGDGEQGEKAAVAVRISGKQFLLMLSYFPDNPDAAKWEKVLDDLIASISVAEPEPPRIAPVTPQFPGPGVRPGKRS